MPTGYTAGVQNGKIVTLEDFAMTCARAFGATVSMRDEPMDAPIGKFEASSYHHERAMEAARELRKVWAMTYEETVEAAERDWIAEMVQSVKSWDEQEAERERYSAMIAKVSRWQPPTEEHVKFKEFMMSQLVESVRFDCSSPRPEFGDPPSGGAWRAKRLEKLQWDLEYHLEGRQKEAERVRGRNQWIEDLRTSLVTP